MALRQFAGTELDFIVKFIILLRQMNLRRTNLFTEFYPDFICYLFSAFGPYGKLKWAGKEDQKKSIVFNNYLSLH